MKMNIIFRNKWLLFQILIMLLWGTQLFDSDAYYVNYFVICIITVICVLKNIKNGRIFLSKGSENPNSIITLFSVLFMLMIASANYRLWLDLDAPEEYGIGFKVCLSILFFVVLFLGSFLTFWNILTVLFYNLKRLTWSECQEEPKPVRDFLLCFLLLAVTRYILLYFCMYPGNLTPDSISQLTQCISGNYTNHHPFYHTMVIRFFLIIGMRIFKDINAAVALYSCFQIAFTSAAFSVTISTMSIMRLPKWIIRACAVFYLMMPYHITYAITMWKDVMFGCFVLLFVVFVFRCLYSIGNNTIDLFALFFSSLGICLFRSNGLFSFVILFVAFLIIWRGENRHILYVLLISLIISFIMKHSVLTKINVVQPDIIESLSIPAQQIARVVSEGCELNKWEEDTISQVIDIDKITDTYKPYISDPIKNLVRDKGAQELISVNKKEYLKLYCMLFIKHPIVYFKAWVDETRGYWNAGYEYWRWSLNVRENDIGVERTVRSEIMNNIFKEYIWLFTYIQILRLFLSIGLFVWIDVIIFMIALLRKDKVGCFAAMPVLAVSASLLIATPVFSEFRYIYSAFCVLPIAIVIILRPLNNNVK